MNRDRAVKILTQLEEKFCKGYKGLFNYTEVYCNPSLQEMESLGKIVRFIASEKDKKVYVWDALKELHAGVAHKMKCECDDHEAIWGSAKKEGNRWRMISSDVIQHAMVARDVEHLLSKEWQWTKKYIEGIREFLQKELMIKT